VLDGCGGQGDFGGGAVALQAPAVGGNSNAGQVMVALQQQLSHSTVERESMQRQLDAQQRELAILRQLDA
jgi:hypothetical protein